MSRPVKSVDISGLMRLAEFMQHMKLLSLTLPDGTSLQMHPDGLTWPEPKPIQEGDDEGDGTGPRGFIDPVVETPQQRIRRQYEAMMSVDKERGSV